MIKPELKERFIKAIQSEKNGDFTIALDEYISILKEDKTYRDVYINLGSLYSRMHNLSDAMKCYKIALSIGKDYLTYFNVGSLYYKMGQYKKAVLMLEHSRNINKKFALSTLVIGLCFSRLNNIKAAETNFTDVLKIWPANRIALTALAIIYYNQERFDEAIVLLNNLLKLENSNIKIREFKSNILYKSGRIDESAHEIKSIKKISDGYRYFDEFIKSIPVEAYEDKYGTMDEKIELLKEKNDKESLFSLSLCHLLKGETDKAIDCLFEVKKKLIN